MLERRIILDHHLAPGDVSLLTPLVRDLKLTYGDRFAIDVRVNFDDIFRGNPYLTRLNSRDKGVEYYKINYRQGIIKAGRGQKIHFMTEFYTQFRQMSRIPVPLLYPRPDFHLSEEEKANPPVSGRYWVVMAGGKTDMTTKIWSSIRWQEVVNQLRDHGLRLVQCGSIKKMHLNPSLENVLNLVGQTSTRTFMNVVYHAEGVICPITFAMHLAGGFEKPCVVLAGGREEPWWESYTNDFNAFENCPNLVRVPHRFLHTIGLLKCCMGKGCWRKKTVKIDKDNNLCHLPIHNPSEQPLPKCLDMLSVDHVVEAVLDYYGDATLPAPDGTSWELPATLPQWVWRRRNDLWTLQSGDPRVDPISQPTGKYRQAAKPPAIDINGGPRVIDLFGLTVPSAAPEPPTVPEPQMLKQPDGPQVAPAIPPLAAAPSAPDINALDNPKIGGKVTVCVLCYGNYHDLHRRCLNSIVATVPAHRLDLRVATNEACLDTINYLNQLPITRLYINHTNRFKYPVMRQMFHDPECPLNTKYLIWFDDDSYVKQPNWLQALAELIVSQPEDVGLYGNRMYHHLTVDHRRGLDEARWFQQAGWCRSRYLRTRKGGEAPNGDCVHFVAGWFWAAQVEALLRCDVPDARLGNNGGDITIGEQFWQGGYKMKQFNSDKVFVYTAKNNRRGVTHPFPWKGYPAAAGVR